MALGTKIVFEEFGHMAGAFFYQYVVIPLKLVAINNKEAATVVEAIFEKWFCRYSIAMEIITDGGKEFCAKV